MVSLVPVLRRRYGSKMDSQTASILHADLDAFFASVEQRDNPELRNIPMAVGVGIVLSASYEARAMGVKTPMNIKTARQYCPNLVMTEPRMEAYEEASRQTFDIFDDTTPLVESLSIDEAFLDVGGLAKLVGSPSVIATKLRQRVVSEVGIPISVGVARTKFLAKVASQAAKPDGLLVVEPDSELEFLHPLPVRALWGVGQVTEQKLLNKGIATVGEVAAAGVEKLETILGATQGTRMFELANNIDRRRVETGKRRSSIGSQQAILSRENISFVEIESLLHQLVDRVAKRLRDGDRVGKTIMLAFRFGDFISDTRSFSFSEPTDSTQIFLDAARKLLQTRKSEIAKRRLTLIGFTVANLSTGDGVQQTLDFTAKNSPKLDKALDAVKDRYGATSIGRAGRLGKDQGISMPLIADPKDKTS